MNRSTQLKMVVCGVALVSLSAIRPASAQVVGSGSCGFGSGFFGSGTPACVEFNEGPQTHRVDYAGNHSFKIIANVVQKFFLEVVSIPTSPPGPTTRYPDPTAEVCIPYVFATALSPGSCALYDVTAFDENGNEIPNGDADQYIDGQIIYRIAWDNPTLNQFVCPEDIVPGVSCYDNPRALRADDEISLFFDVTDGVFPTLVSGEDPGVNTSVDGWSQYIVVQQAHSNNFGGCIAPLNCSDPNNPAANVFNLGQAVPVRIFLNPHSSGADIRLTVTDSDGNVFLAEAAGNSNIGNQFRRIGTRYEFNWKTTGLEAGDYQLTISTGTDSGDLFAPVTIMVRLQ